MTGFESSVEVRAAETPEYVLNDAAEFTRSSTSPFVFSLCTLFSEIRSYRFVYRVFWRVFTTIYLVQLLFLSLLMNRADYWEGVPFFDYYAQIFNCIVRFMPMNSCFQSHFFAVIVVFCLSFIQLVHLLFVFYGYDPASTFTSSAVRWTPLFSICFSRIALVPSISLLFYAILRANQTYGVIMVVLSVINVVLQLVATFVLNLLEKAFPSFRKAIGTYWIRPSFLFVSAYLLVLVALGESAAKVGSRGGRLAMSLIMALLYYIHAQSTCLTMSLVTVWSNCLQVGGSLVAMIYSIIGGFADMFGWDPRHLLLLDCLIFVPVFAVGGLIVVHRRKKALLRAVRMGEDGDLGALENMSRVATVGTICSAFALHPGDWRMLDWLLKKYPDNFDYLTLYAKFVVAMPDENERLAEVLRDMHRLCGRNSTYCLTTGFIEMIYVQRGSPDVFYRTNLDCCQVVDDYLMALHLFWTEILLGRSDRLVSLSHSVNEKYMSAQAFFEHLGTTAAGLEHYQRYRSISALQFESMIKRKNRTISNTALRDTYEVLSDFHFDDGDKIGDEKDRMLTRSITVEQAAADISARVSRVQHLLLYCPLYIALLVIVMIIVALFVRNDSVHAYWEYEEALVGVVYPFTASILMSPMALLQEYGFVNKSVFEFHLANNILFACWLQSPMKGVVELSSAALTAMKSLLTAQEQLESHHLSMTSETSDLNIYPNPSKSNFRTFMKLYPYINLFSLRYSNYTDSSVRDLDMTFRNNESQFMAYHHLQVIDFVSSFLMDSPEVFGTLIKDRNGSVLLRLEICVTVFLLFSFVCQIVALHSLSYTYQDVFRLLFAMPKISISQLIDKLGSRISTKFAAKENLDSDLKYNLTQLSYQEAPQSYLTTRKRMTIVTVVCFLVLLILRFLFTPVTFMARAYLDCSLGNLKMASAELTLPMLYMMIGHDALELLWLSKQNVTPPDNYRSTLTERLYTMTDFLYKNLSQSVTDISRYPSFHNTSLFLDPVNCSDDQSPIVCRSLAGELLFMVTTVFAYINDVIEDRELDDRTVATLVGSIVSLISRHVPAVNRDLFAGAENAESRYLARSVAILCVYIVVVAILLILNRRCLSRRMNDRNFALSFLSSIPATVLANFSTYSGALRSEEQANSSTDIGSYIFEEDNAFQHLVENIFLVDSDNNIVAVTPSAQSKLQVEELADFKQFVDNLASYSVDLELPPSKPEVIHIDVSMPGMPPMFMKTSVFPVKKFNFNNGIVSYACTMEDVSQRESLISQLNLEANRVRMLMTQLVPWPVASLILSGGEITPVILPKIICVTFLVRSTGDLFSQDDLLKIQEIIRGLLQKNRFLTYFGRSIQMFRVVSGLFNAQMASTEQGVKTVSFALDLISQIRAYASQVGKGIDVHCGVHTSGPFYADVVETSPPVYDLFGLSLTVSELVASKGSPNRVNITRDVYELIFGQGFEITFENEIENTNGTVLLIHIVHPTGSM